jgi:hypothetical protein
MFSTIHSQIMQATGNFHGRIGRPGFLVPKDIFDNPAPLHSGDGVFYADTQLRQLAVSLFLCGRKFTAPWLFFSPGRSAAQPAHIPEILYPYTG